MENLKVGQKVRIKSKEWYDECKCLGFKLPEDKAIFDMFHVGQIGNIESIFGDLVSVKFYDGDYDLFHKWWLEPISDGWVSTDEDHKLYIPSDEELKKSVTVNVPIDMEVSTKECGGKITINVHHKEEKVEEPKFKNGDIIYSEIDDGYSYIAIYKDSESDGSFIIYHVMISCDNYITFDGVCGADIFRLATKEEKEKLFKELANQKQLRWNAEELKFEPIRWRAEHGETYWHITGIGTIISSIECFDPMDNILYKLMNYFKTEKLANQALPKWKEFFKNLKL